MVRVCGYLLCLLVVMGGVSCARDAGGAGDNGGQSLAQGRATGEACPVTQPLEPPFRPPGEGVAPFEGTFWYGSDDLYLALPLDGTWAQLAHGEKLFWWSVHYEGEWQPAMTLRAERLDGSQEIVEQIGATNARHNSFPAVAMLQGVDLPSGGCWQITGTYEGAALTFVVWVP